jgi:lysophospholipase L1-like esterase
LREALKVYKEDTDAIFAELVSLRSPSDALIRTMDFPLNVKELKATGAFEVINTYWQDANEYVIQVAGEHHIPVARVYAAFMGPNGDEDPMDKGYVFDGIHPTEKGADLMAELFRELGYEYAPPEP